MIGKNAAPFSNAWNFSGPAAGPGRIAAVRLHTLDIPLREDFAISGSRAGEANNLLVEIRTADGLTGWGEASPLQRVSGENQAACIAASRRLIPLLEGRTLEHLPATIEHLVRCSPDTPTAVSAFDIALFDLAAQRAGLPLCEFLGGRAVPMPTDATIFLRPVDRVAERALELVAEGFQTLKIKLGDPARDDVERVRRVREAVGDGIDLRADANQGWDRDYALAVLEAIAPFRVQFCEQPLPAERLDDIRWLAQRSPVPLMADESLFSPEDAARLAADAVYPLFNIKLSKSAGLLRARAIAAVAHGAGIGCQVGCMNESRLGLTAAAHLAAAAPAVNYFDLDSHLMQTVDWIEGGLRIERGVVHLPTTPGLGARPAQDAPLRDVTTG